jgi:uncharacterized protein YndB with AHSA1/START domain
MTKSQNIVTSITVEIEAPASVVWKVLTDLDRYSEWNTFCPGIKSTLKLGDPVTMTVKSPNSDELGTAVEYLVCFEPEQLLSWEARPTAESKAAARRDQYVQALGPERCSYVTTDVFLGPIADDLMKNIGSWAKAGFDDVARGLKRQAEAIYAQQKARITVRPVSGGAP